MKTCKDCKFWVEQEAQDPKQNNGILRGECRYNPPIATGSFLPKVNMISGDMEPQLIETTVWACTFATYWCGKWEARPSTDRLDLTEREKELKAELGVGRGRGKDENENEQA